MISTRRNISLRNITGAARRGATVLPSRSLCGCQTNVSSGVASRRWGFDTERRRLVRAPGDAARRGEPLLARNGRTQRTQQKFGWFGCKNLFIVTEGTLSSEICHCSFSRLLRWLVCRLLGRSFARRSTTHTNTHTYTNCAQQHMGVETLLCFNSLPLSNSCVCCGGTARRNAARVCRHDSWQSRRRPRLQAAQPLLVLACSLACLLARLLTCLSASRPFVQSQDASNQIDDTKRKRKERDS